MCLMLFPSFPLSQHCVLPVYVVCWAVVGCLWLGLALVNGWRCAFSGRGGVGAEGR